MTTADTPWAFARMIRPGVVEVRARAESEDGQLVGDYQEEVPLDEFPERGWRIEPVPQRVGDEAQVYAADEQR